VLKDLIEQGLCRAEERRRAIAANAGYGSPKKGQKARGATSPTGRASASARAYRETGADSVEGFRKVLLGLLDPARTRGCRQAGARRRTVSMDASADKPHILVVDDDNPPARTPEDVPLAQRLSRHHGGPIPPRPASALAAPRLRPDRARRHDAGPDRPRLRRRAAGAPTTLPILMLTAMGERARTASPAWRRASTIISPSRSRWRELLLRIQSVLRRNRPAAEAGRGARCVR